jgi:hypothetical protein
MTVRKRVILNPSGYCKYVTLIQISSFLNPDVCPEEPEGIARYICFLANTSPKCQICPKIHYEIGKAIAMHMIV